MSMAREEQFGDECDDLGTEQLYEIKVAGPLEAHWQQWFEGMTLEIRQNAEDGTTYTVITGPVKDQPALHGLLSTVRDLNLTLISVRRLASSTAGENEGDQDDKQDHPSSG
jgi:hypothetical protein